MKCPACGAEARRRDDVCYRCGQPLHKTHTPKDTRSPGMKALRAVALTLCVLVALAVFSLLFYRAYFWISAWRLSRVYESGEMMAPLVEEIEMDYGQTGHAITFYGEDGDSIFLKELRRSYPFSGNIARIEILDSDWFHGESPEEVESANVTLVPILTKENGAQQQLPPLTFTVAMPSSPLKLLSPEESWAQVNTSIFQMRIQVVPGSTVLVNGEDATNDVDYAGQCSVNLNIYPKGDNEITLLVQSPNYRETRMMLTLYRPYQEINLEPSLNLKKTTSRKSFTVSGTVDPTATLTVDTPHKADSIKVSETGSFSFVATMTVVGDNTITFRASQAGKADSVVSVSVYYVPTLKEYTDSAWVMSYAELKLYADNVWQGRVFLCKGTVEEIITKDEEQQQVIMNVGTAQEPKYVILDNFSSVGTPVIGTTYRAYADAVGTQFYNDDYCPLLACRYMLSAQ